MAKCGELADYLAAEIILKIKTCDADLNRVTSTKVNHGYLHINIHLENEESPSNWEIDAWDPRIICINEEVINNNDLLNYGCHPQILFSIEHPLESSGIELRFTTIVCFNSTLRNFQNNCYFFRSFTGVVVDFLRESTCHDLFAASLCFN